MNLFTKLALILKERKVRFPSPPHVPKLPRFSFGNKSASKAVVFAVGMATAVVAVGIYFSVKDVATASWDWPEAGAEYNLPHKMGEKLPPYADGSESQTLKINLADGTRLSSLTLNNLDLGKTGLSDCIEVTRQQGNSSGWLYVDNWTATGVTAPSADFANSEIANLSLAAYVDGHTVEATIDSTISDLDIQSTRGSGVFTAENSVVDRVLIVLAGDAVIGTLAMTDVDCSVGGWNVDYVKAGSFTMDNTSKFGGLNAGIDAADFVVQSTVKTRSFTDNLVDTPITVR